MTTKKRNIYKYDNHIKSMNKCENCKYEWQSRTKDPKSCPRCKSYWWNVKKEVDKIKKEVLK